MNCDILSYGAIGDGVFLNTACIQAAIDDCASHGGGRVTVPQGTFYTGTLRLKSHVELHLMHGAVLLASRSMDDYNPLDEYEQNFSCGESEKWLGKHLILAVECDDVALTGSGIIDGSGDFYFGEPKPFSRFCWRDGLAVARDLSTLRPGQLICFIECTRIKIRDVSVRNATCWCFFLHGCDQASIDGIRVENKSFHGNTDGIDLDSCSHVTVSNCIIRTGDDGITFRADEKHLKNKNQHCEYITVTNCVIASSSSAFRIGVGTGSIRHIRVSGITIERSSIAADFQTSYAGRGCANMDDIRFSNLSAVDTAYPISLTVNNGASVRNLVFENVYAQSFAAIRLRAEKGHDCANITLKNVDFNLIKGPEGLTEREHNLRGDCVISAENIKNLTLEDIRLTADEPACAQWEDFLRIRRCENAHLRGVTLP